MKSSHIPGPWKYHLGRGVNPRFHIQDMGGYQIASTTELNKHPAAREENEAREANARMITASPDMFKVCLLVRTLLDSMQKTPEVRKAWSDTAFDSCTGEALRQLDAVISKAEGNA